MNVKENDNLLSVYAYDKLKIKDVLNAYKTTHSFNERIERINKAIELKFIKDYNSFIATLIARPNQVKHL